jgi:hypothetical protein
MELRRVVVDLIGRIPCVRPRGDALDRAIGKLVEAVDVHVRPVRQCGKFPNEPVAPLTAG